MMPSRSTELRRLLKEQCPTVESLDAFCLDHFAEVHGQFAPGMGRLERENMLIAEVGLERVWAVLHGGRTPGDLSSLPPNNLPVRNATFVGRRPKLAELHCALMAEGRATVVPRQVFGLGGVGKTSLALEYAHEHAHDYPGGLWWVRAEGEPADALVVFAGELRLAAPLPVLRVLERLPLNAPNTEVARCVRLALQSVPAPSLLVLDNVSHDGWREHLPAGAVRVLATTRDRAHLRDVAAVQLESLTDEEARRLAETIAGAPPDSADVAARDRVLRDALGNLPVAVEVAARGVATWGMSWREYEGHLAEQPSRVLEADDVLGHYPRGALAALELSIAHAGAGSPARRLLEAAAVFAPDAIPREWAAAVAEIDDDFLVRQAAGTLKALGLLTTDAACVRFDLHRLVRLTVRTIAGRPEHREPWAAMQRRALFRVLEWMDATVNIARLPEVEARRVHVEELIDATQTTDERAWSALTDRFATHLWHRAELPRARILRERALRADETTLGPDHADVAAHLSNLALVLRDLGNAAEAKPLLERALRINERTFGPYHPAVAIRLSNLATVLRDLGDAAGARPLLERALRIDENTLEPDYPTVSIRLSNLATVLRDLGDAAGARPLLERALRIDENTFGPDHPTVARDLSNLATVLRDLGDSARAKPMLERALRIDENAFGPSHPIVAIRLSNLATVPQDLGDPAGARPLLERALRINENTLGRDHPDVARDLSNLAVVRKDLGDAAGAKSLLERALQINENTFGPEHPTVAIFLSNMALVLRDLGDAEGARPLLERALRINENTFGLDHPAVAIRLSNLALVLQDLGDAVGARPLLVRAIAILAARLGADHPNTRRAVTPPRMAS